jgi:phosphopantothenoylcysteine decarboxylase/phosphopantothenate--cysteine ligase
MSAAVEDISPKTSFSGKLKKDKIPQTIELTKTDDILKELGKQKKDQVLVGFSVEVKDDIKNSIEKMKKKNLDWIIVNNPEEKGAAFSGDTNRVTIIDKDYKNTSLPLLSKRQTAEAIWRTITNTKD